MLICFIIQRTEEIRKYILFAIQKGLFSKFSFILIL